MESAEGYNQRLQQSIDTFFGEGETVAIIGPGRRSEERSLVLVEKGNYLGYGFFSGDNDFTVEKINRLIDFFFEQE